MMHIVHTEDYAKMRSRSYPPVEEQLDALWHAMDQGLLPKAEPFYSAIRDVKQRFPKEAGQPCPT